ncbi:MAG: 2Fe-2S iron-sulfur cluster-binding protein [Vicinamibacterales bacterium]
MPRVEYDGRSCDRREGESVLDALLRAGVAVPYSCKAGSCGSCLLRSRHGIQLPAVSQQGLKDAWKANGYFLSCVCVPEGDLDVVPVGAEMRTAVTVTSLDRLSDSVLRVRLTSESPFGHHPGQYLTLFRGDGLARSYSIASLPADGALELHVRLLPGGRMSQWLAHEATIGATLHIQGPSGDCFYVPDRQDGPLLLAGTGTGLAPIYGIAREALSSGHRGPIILYHGAATSSGLYLQEQLRALAAEHNNFTYTPTVLDIDGPIDRAILARHLTVAGWRAYLCGDPAVVQTLKKKLFLAGAALNDIHADAFLPSAIPDSGPVAAAAVL